MNNTDISLEDYLEAEDMGTFHSHLESVAGGWGSRTRGSVLQENNRRVSSSPPVTLYVGSIPLGLTREGLQNTFLPFGDLLKVNLVKGKDSRFNIGFVTFCKRRDAVEAIYNVHQRAPLFLVVKYNMGPEEKEKRLEIEEFSKKWEQQSNTPEQDYDEEIASEERMAREVDKFLDDYFSENEVPVNESSSDENKNIKRKQISERLTNKDEEKYSCSLKNTVLDISKCSEVLEEHSKYLSIHSDSSQDYISLKMCTQTNNESSVAQSNVDMQSNPAQNLENQITVIEPFDIGTEMCIVTLLDINLTSKEAVVKIVEDMDGGHIRLSEILSKCSPEESLTTSSPVKGQLVAALSSNGVYLRVRVDHVDYDSKQAHCRPVDGLGELMVRHFSSLSPLPKESSLVPILIRKVQLILGPLSRITSSSIGQHFKLKPVTVTLSPPLVELVPLKNMRQDGVQNISIEQKTENVKEKVNSSDSSYLTAVSSLKLSVGSHSWMIVLNVNSPRDVHLCMDLSKLKELQSAIYNIGESMMPNTNYCPAIGSLVLVKSVDDGYWYRAVVEKVNDMFVSVFCADFGFRDDVSLNMIRRTNQRLNIIQQKFLGCRCILADWADEVKDCSERELRNLKKLLPVNDKKVSVTIVDKRIEGYVVKISGVNKKAVSGHIEDPKEELARLRSEVALLRKKLGRLA